MNFNLEKSVGSQETAQSIDAPGEIEKPLITSKVTTSFSIPPCTPMAYTSFLRPTDFSRFNQYLFLKKNENTGTRFLFFSTLLTPLIYLMLSGCSNSGNSQRVIENDHCAEASATEDIKLAPPGFNHGQDTVVFVDFKKVSVNMEFDSINEQAKATATVDFYMHDCGIPVIDLIPEPTEISIDGTDLSSDHYPTISDPDHQSNFRVLLHRLQPGEHQFKVSYPIKGKKIISYNEDEVKFFTYMDDWDKRPYSERYFPANFIYDRYAIETKITLINTDQEHQIFTNGNLRNSGFNLFEITFPEHGNSSWPYINLVSSDSINILNSNYSGASATIPVTVYSQEGSDIQTAMDTAIEQLKLLESKFGRYPHDRLTIGLNHSVTMEYPGATMVDLGTLEHELAHMWFGRGFFPKNGNAEWIDEAIATWHENGYQRASKPDEYAHAHLAGFSPYRRHLPTDAYRLGSRVIEMLDRQFASQGGMQPILKDLAQSRLFETLSTAQFIEFLNGYSSTPLNDFFSDKVYGGPAH